MLTYFSQQVSAQDSAFLACGQLSDRGQRIACLEDALETALAADRVVSGGSESIANSASVEMPLKAPVAEVAEVAEVADVPESPAAVQRDEKVQDAENDRSLVDRIRSFGSRDQTSISSDASGQDQLHDTITELEQRNNLWTVTLASGQVWRQEVSRFYNLREGDEITIYRAGIGNGYRMATGRLSGFIRVERIK